MQFNDLFIDASFPANIKADEPTPKLITIKVQWDTNLSRSDILQINWAEPVIDIQYQWHPLCKFDHSLNVDWYPPMVSRAASSAPVYSYYNALGRNRLTMALSDASTPINTSIGVHEEDGTLIFKVEIPMKAMENFHTYTITLYRDYDDISFSDALRRVSMWWETDCNMKPVIIPQEAKEPIYSFWYSFHQATIAEKIEAECVRAKEFGFHTVIIDDGWQTEDENRGYGFCGDWSPAPSKIPDMKEHVRRIHSLGLKYVLWFSVPFIGYYSKQWDRFKNMILERKNHLATGVLDPRFPEVREYLIGIYEKALRDWDIDGFKLDFFDEFKGHPAPDPTPDMDYDLIEPAVIRLITDITGRLNAIKPGLLFELRQNYIGPLMRLFGNMFRVADCPDDALSNRVGVIDLRLLSGSTPVHSDMLMWHRNETSEAAAMQIQSVLFSVPQISVKLDTLSTEHAQLLRYWLDFIRSHRDLLIDAPIEVESPQDLYPIVRVQKDGKAIIAVYSEGRIVKMNPSEFDVWIINANGGHEVVLDLPYEKNYEIVITDCIGHVVEKNIKMLSGLSRLCIPRSGAAHLCDI